MNRDDHVNQRGWARGKNAKGEEVTVALPRYCPCGEDANYRIGGQWLCTFCRQRLHESVLTLGRAEAA